MFLLPFIGHSQKTVNKFIDQVKKDDRAFAMTFPGWLIRKGSRMAFDFSQNENDIEVFYSLSQSIKGLRFVMVEKGFVAKDGMIQNFIRDVQDKEGFEPYVTARDDGNNVNVMIREDGDKIKNLLILVNGDDNIVVANLKTDFTLEQLKRANLSFNKHKKDM